MNRRYLRDLYEDRVSIIKAVMPDCCIGVDVITGFPGESYEDFLDTYNFINKLDISYLHVFTYSERQNTKAIEMDEVVPVKERNERSKMLRILSDKKKRAFYEENIGTTRTVLYEDDVDNGKMHGFTENYLRIEADYNPLLINKTQNVVIKGISDRMTMQIKVESRVDDLVAS